MGKRPTQTNTHGQELGHQALSLGLTDKVRNILNQSNLNLQDATRRQWKFRLARLSGAENPYAELIPPEIRSFTDWQMDRARSMGEPAVVSVPGGIGDHLELISSLFDWSQMKEHPLILQVTPQRQEALAPLIASTPQLELDSNIVPRQFQAWRCGNGCADTLGRSAIAPGSNNFASQVELKGILCCWKAKGEGTPLCLSPLSSFPTSSEIL